MVDELMVNLTQNIMWYGTHVQQIDRELLKQPPPTEFSRPPQSIHKHFKYWKASELRYWLLYYSLPLLMRHLPSLYWHHYALLVCAVHIMHLVIQSLRQNRCC